MRKSFKICLNAVLASGVLLLSGCSQGAASYREVEEKCFQNLKKTIDDVVLESDMSSATDSRMDIELSIPYLSEVGGIDLSTLSLYLDSTEKDDVIYGIFGALINGKEVKAECWADKSEGKAYALLPDISDICAYYDFSEYLPKTEIDYGELFSEIQNVIKKRRRYILRL